MSTSLAYAARRENPDGRIRSCRSTSWWPATPGQAVLHRVDLHVAAGEVVSLLGANGAGKSTLLKTVMGTVPVIGGSIRLEGIDIRGWAPHKRVAAGIGFSPEGRRIFANLSAEDNLLMGAAALPQARRRGGLDYAYSLFPILRERRTSGPGRCPAASSRWSPSRVR